MCISMGCQIGSICVLHQKLVRASSGSAEMKKTAQFWRDRETPRCISALQDPLSASFFFLEYPCHGDQFRSVLVVKTFLEQQGNPFSHAPKCMEKTFSQDRLQRLFWISGPRKPPDWIGPTILAFYWRLRWPAVGLENIALTASTSSVFPAEVDMGQSAHDTYPTGEMPLSPLPV